MGVVLGEGVHPRDVGRFHAVEHHVHRADAQHGLVSIKAGEHAGGEVALVGGLHQFHGVMLGYILRRSADEARAAHGRVYVPTDFDTKEKALSVAKAAEKGLK